MRSADIADVVEVEESVFSTPWSAETFERLLGRDGLDLLVLVDREEMIVGYAVLWCVLDQGELANLAVRPRARGLGLGRRLLDEVVATCRRNGVRRLYLEVRESNEAAVSLYLSEGFVEVGRRRDYYRLPVEAARVMELSLD